MEEVKTTAPPPRLFSAGSAYFSVSRPEPMRFTATLVAICSSLAVSSSSSPIEMPMPALAKTKSRPPKVSSARATAAFSMSPLRTSQLATTARPPASVISVTAALRRSVRRAASTTAVPWAARYLAAWRPMPLEAPVTRATCSFRGRTVGPFAVAKGAANSAGSKTQLPRIAFCRLLSACRQINVRILCHRSAQLAGRASVRYSTVPQFGSVRFGSVRFDSDRSSPVISSIY
mmetsp:Transcript_2170/g.6271  ORF Transcript_2170/g.6271 Transcript_2170/m.6271 type:complete len:232 (-) Transcript_2170:213-908(-)